VVFALWAALPAIAQPRESHFDFGGVALEGELQRPDGEMLLGAPWRAMPADRAGDVLASVAAVLALADRHDLRGYRDDERAISTRDPRVRARMEAAARSAHERARRLRSQAVSTLSGIVDPPASAASPSVAKGLEWRGALREMLGDRDGALADARRIALECSGCPQAPRAWLTVGERAFENAMLDDALVAYGRVISATQADAALRAYARYKMAWCEWNLGRFDAALVSFEHVMRDAAGQRTGEALRREAARDAVHLLATMPARPSLAILRIRTFAVPATEIPRLLDRYTARLDDAGRAHDAAEARVRIAAPE
jgi:hypothetical protein